MLQGAANLRGASTKIKTPPMIEIYLNRKPFIADRTICDMTRRMIERLA